MSSIFEGQPPKTSPFSTKNKGLCTLSDDISGQLWIEFTTFNGHEHMVGTSMADRNIPPKNLDGSNKKQLRL